MENIAIYFIGWIVIGLLVEIPIAIKFNKTILDKQTIDEIQQGCSSNFKFKAAVINTNKVVNLIKFIFMPSTIIISLISRCMTIWSINRLKKFLKIYMNNVVYCTKVTDDALQHLCETKDKILDIIASKNLSDKNLLIDKYMLIYKSLTSNILTYLDWMSEDLVSADNLSKYIANFTTVAEDVMMGRVSDNSMLKVVDFNNVTSYVNSVKEKIAEYSKEIEMP